MAVHVVEASPGSHSQLAAELRLELRPDSSVSRALPAPHVAAARLSRRKAQLQPDLKEQGVLAIEYRTCFQRASPVKMATSRIYSPPPIPIFLSE